MTPIDKLITILRIVHAAMPEGALIKVQYEGPRRGDGWVITHTLGYSALAESDTIGEDAIIPAMGAISSAGRMLDDVRNIAAIAADLLEAIGKEVDQKATLSEKMKEKRDDPRFGRVPPLSPNVADLEAVLMRLGRAAANARGVRFNGVLLGPDGVESDIAACVKRVAEERRNAAYDARQ